MTAHANELTDIVRRLYAAWPAHDRETLEALVADDFHFTSPLDNRLDRKTFFERCWPNNETMASMELDRVMVSGDFVTVTYEATVRGGKRFRNTEVLVVRDGKVHDVEVFFGWNVPHPAKKGGWIDDASA